ncbi:MAG: hypothetical protein WDN31_05870 [Hyphomicrobium sp.]
MQFAHRPADPGVGPALRIVGGGAEGVECRGGARSGFTACHLAAPGGSSALHRIDIGVGGGLRGIVLENAPRRRDPIREALRGLRRG